MRFLVIGFSIALVFGESAVSQEPAHKGVPGKGKRPTGAPKGGSSSAEPEKAPATKLTPKGGGSPKEFPALASIRYLIGVSGYSDREGIVVISSAWAKDLDQRSKVRSPASEFDVDLKGNGKPTKVKLEPGDRITAIAGYEVRSMQELSIALNAAPDPHKTDISFVDWRTGREYSGVINAMRIR